MGIQNYLKRVSKATTDIKSAIEEKGVPVAQCDGYEQLADKVRAIQTGSSVEYNDLLFTMLAFKQSTSMPGTPTGGSFSETGITYPSGWSDGAGLSENVWMSYCVIKGDGSVYKDWVTPIKLSGVSEIDLTNYALKSWVTDQISNIDFDGSIDLSAYATKDYVQNEIAKIQTGGSVDLSNYATKAYSDSGDSSTLASSKKYTDDEIAKIQTGGSVDLSSYATKSEMVAGDEATLSEAKKYAEQMMSESGVTSINSISGEVILKGSDSVAISRSGNSLIFTTTGGGTGGDGKDGDTIRSFNIYINTDSNVDIPDIPVNYGKQPYWDYTTGNLENVPTGWSTDMTSEPTKYTWMAVGFFSKNSAGAQLGTWDGPFCITGEPGQPGEDGSNFEFIYALTPDSDHKPAYPSTDAQRKVLFDSVEQGDSSTAYGLYNGQKWYDRAQSIDPTTNRACWMAQRVKYAGSEDWNFYSEPVIWANWGSDGTDGDGVEYIFFLTDDAHQSSGKWYSDAENFEITYDEGTVNGVATTYENTIDDWVPKGWTDEPQDVSETDGFYEFCAVRKSKNGIWEEFSEPALWAKYAMDGKDGASIEYVFARCVEKLTPEQVSIDNEAANRDGAGTTDEYLPNFNFNGTITKATDDPVSVTQEIPYQWVSIRRRKRGESVWGDFSHPALWNMWSEGSQGPKGEDGDMIEEVYAVYNSVAVMPTISTPSTDANGKTVSEDGYLPNFVFGTVAVPASGILLSVDSTNRYLFKSTRRKHNGVWLSFSDPVISGNWTETELSPEEIEKLKDNIKTDIEDSLTEASQRVDALQNRIDSIDYTDATFVKDPNNALIAAITQYKDADQKSFADLVIDGKEAEIKALAGAEVNGHLTEAGIDLDGLGGTLKTFADFKDKTTGDISSVSTKLNSLDAQITNAATHEDLGKVNSAIQTINGKNAEIINAVSKSTYIWVKKDSEGNVIPDSVVEYDASQYLAEDATYEDKDAYETAMKNSGYELDLSVHAFSQIKQTAGEVDITAGDGQAAQLKIYGDNETSKIIMKAKQVDFSGSMNGKDLTVTDLIVTGTKGAINPATNLPQLGATINSAYINDCQINSCTINSQIKSKTYTYHDDALNKEGKGFLIDSGAVEAGGLEFAFYANDGGRITNTEIVTKKIQSTNFNSEEKTGFSLDSSKGADGTIKNQFALYGTTSDGENFELTNDNLSIPAAAIKGLTVDSLQSTNYTEDSDGNPNFEVSEEGSVGFKISSSENKFYVKGNNYELNNGVISLKNTDDLILGGKSFTDWIKNAGEWDGLISNIQGDLNVEGSITAQRLYAKGTVNGTEYSVKVGDLVESGSSEYFKYISAEGSSVWRSHDSHTWDDGEVENLKQSFTIVNGTTLIIPSHYISWRIHAVTTGTISTLPAARLIVKNSQNANVLDTGFIAGKEGTGRTTLSGSASGTNYYGMISIPEQRINITPGVYFITYQVKEEHLGANMLYASNFKFTVSTYSPLAINNSKADRGVSLGGNGLLVKAGDQSTDASKITEASISVEGGKVSSTGFVLSPTITTIKQVDSADEAASENDPNTLYIIINNQ